MLKKKVISWLLIITICLSSIPLSKLSEAEAEAEAATNYIKIGEFIKTVVSELNLPVDNQTVNAYIAAAIKWGIVKEGEYKDYNSYLTRTDCAVIANRMDRYINGISNYAQEVYELLSRCNYLDGLLYYNVKNDLYPAGATKDTYPASQFLSEKIEPITNKYFSADANVKKGLRVGYEYIYDDDKDNILDRYMVIGLKPPAEDNFFGIDPLVEDSSIVKAWNKIKDYDRKVAAVLKSRISDINKISKNKRQDVAEAFAKGIITGYSNGMYVQNREYRGENKITASAAKSIIQKVLQPEKRSPISPDGQLIRTTNLPKNAKDYPYILAAFPNSFYEMNYSFMYYDSYIAGKIDRSIYRYPSETTFDFLYNTYYKGNISLEMDKYEYYDKAISQAKQYLDCVFNMNYKTVNQAWIDKLASSYAPFGGDNIYDLINEYLAAAKKNHVVVESKLISVEPSTLYYDMTDLYIRAYVKYRITADNINVDQDTLLYGNYNYLIGLKNGEWRYGYYDIPLRATYNSSDVTVKFWGVHSFVNISDWALKMPY